MLDFLGGCGAAVRARSGRWPQVVALLAVLAVMGVGGWLAGGAAPAPALAVQVTDAEAPAAGCTGSGCIDFSTPPDGSRLAGATVTFSWITDPVFAASTTFRLTVTPQGGSPIVVPAAPSAATSQQVTGLPTDCRQVTATVQSYFAGKASRQATNTYQASGCPPPTATPAPTPAPTATPVPSATPTARPCPKPGTCTPPPSPTATPVPTATPAPTATPTATPGPTASPTPTPTPTPTPGGIVVRVNPASANLTAGGGTTTVNLQIVAGAAKIGSWDVSVTFNSSVAIVANSANCGPQQGSVCNENFSNSGSSRTLKVTGANAAGLTGTFSIANITFTSTGGAGATTPLTVGVVTLTDDLGANLARSTANGALTIVSAPITTGLDLQTVPSLIGGLAAFGRAERGLPSGTATGMRANATTATGAAYLPDAARVRSGVLRATA